MSTVSRPPDPGENNDDGRAGVHRTALKVAGGSAAGLAGILTASAFGAVSTPLAIVAVVVFGVIMVGALIMVG